MTRPLLASAVLVTATLAASSPAWCATDADLAEIRVQIQQLKDAYEARINALEARLRDAEANAARAAPPTAGAPPQPAALPAPSTSGGGGIAAFNPAVSLVLQGTYANLSQDPKAYALSGFQKSPDVSPGRRGLSLGESELALSANVDDKFAGNLIVSLTPENTVSVEEAYGFMPSLPNGLVPKFGRFFSGIGYLNQQHQHAWDFQDAPLAYQAFLGGQFAQDGVQVKWVAPTEHFIELGAEIGNGDSFPGSERDRNGVGAAAVFAHTGGDVGDSHSWRAGLSYLALRPRGREASMLDTTGNVADVAFSGRSHVAIADFVWKYAPHGNATQTNFKVQGEYFWRRERGELTDDPGGLAQTDAYAANQRGWYLQGVYQFMPYWRTGLRYDRLDPGRPQYGANADLLDVGAFHPERITAMVDYTPSEFSRFRLQYADSRTLPGVTDHQWFLQYILTLGAHGAHQF
ncbi:MAG TPA: hypothetical protein VLR71_20470 [Casimicrobiaceae bacterium]|nr:hypothetical protein [Casimicrobiaceae bacterium]